MEPLHDPRREIYVIIDGPNVVREGETPASMQKLVAAIAYFLVLQETKSRIKCMAFVPNHWLNQKQSENSELTPEDQEILQALAHQGHVALVPSQSHDDYYILDYAMEKDGYIVTNDMFRDHISKKVTFRGQKLTSKWVKSHCITFTFATGIEFRPDGIIMEKVRNDTGIPKPTGPTIEDHLSSLLRRPIQRQGSYISAGVALKAQKATKREEEDEVHEAMMVDHTQERRKAKIDVSEVSYFKIPYGVLPFLHESIRLFEEQIGAHIPLPSLSPHQQDSSKMRHPLTPITLTIYGAEENRQRAIHELDRLQQQFMLQHQQQLQLTSHHHAYDHHSVPTLMPYGDMSYSNNSHSHTPCQSHHTGSGSIDMDIDPYH